MLPTDLPKLGVIHTIERDFVPALADISGKNVLCIGFTEFEMDDYIAKHQPASITALTYWSGHRDSELAKYRLVIGDITKRTEFADNAFDAVISNSTLEHLTPLEDGLIEMKRITRNGGDVLAFFGPAWSCPYGHHIYETSSGASADMFIFSKWRMPAFMHLLCAPHDIAAYYRSLGFSKELSRGVLHWFYDAPHINRVMYDDYIRLFSKHFTIFKMMTMWNDVPNDLLARLRARYQGYMDFSTYGGAYGLRVSK